MKTTWTIVLGMLGMLTATVQADMLKYRAAQAAEASLIHRYAYEHTELADALRDRADGVDFTAYVKSGYAGSLALLPSWSGDGVGVDVPPPAGDYLGAYATGNPVGLGTNSTVELLIQPCGDGLVEAGILSHMPNERFYLTQRNHSTAGQYIYWTRGDNTGGAIIGNTSPVAFAVSNWYYVALSSSYVPGDPATYTLNVHVKNLTTDGPLTRVLDDVSTAAVGTGGVDLTGVFRIGMDNSVITRWFGRVDELAIYQSVLPPAAISNHVAMLLAPPPEVRTNFPHFRAAQRAETSLVHQYPFEGEALSESLEDRIGDLDFSTGASGGYAGSVSAVDTWSPGSQALWIPRPDSATVGASAWTAYTFTPGVASTVEFLVYPMDTAFVDAHIVSHYGNPQRFYFRQTSTGMQWWRGASGSADIKKVAGSGSVEPMVVSNWYYVALASEYVPAAAETNYVLNVYIKNLTANSALERVVADEKVLVTGPVGDPSTLRLGASSATAAKEWYGLIDELAIYDAVLGPEQIQAHLDELNSLPRGTVIAIR